MSLSALELINCFSVSLREFSGHCENMRLLLELLKLLLKLILIVDKFAPILEKFLPLGIYLILSFRNNHPLLIKFALQIIDLIQKLTWTRGFQRSSLDVQLALFSNSILNLRKPLRELLQFLLVRPDRFLTDVRRRLKNRVPRCKVIKFVFEFLNIAHYLLSFLQEPLAVKILIQLSCHKIYLIIRIVSLLLLHQKNIGQIINIVIKFLKFNLLVHQLVVEFFFHFVQIFLKLLLVINYVNFLAVNLVFFHLADFVQSLVAKAQSCDQGLKFEEYLCSLLCNFLI